LAEVDLIHKVIDLFIEMAVASGATALPAHDPGEFRKVISTILEDEPGAVFCPALTEMEILAAIPPERRTAKPEDAEITIEEVSAGIVETGSLVCSSLKGKPLSAGSLSWHYIAIVSTQNLFPTFEDFLVSCSPLPTHLTFVSGPSRTTDIEKTLVIGMHGPAKVTVIIY
jgi:L-lactate dehydrogenase complex protein LldG